MFKQVKLILKGGAIGVANIIPGVSGGTMAVVLGIYEELIEAIGNFATNRAMRKTYAFLLLKIGIGAVSAIVALSWLMDFLLTDYPIYTYLFFIGLIAGSIPSIYKAHNDMKASIPAALSFLAGFAIILTFALAFPDLEGTKDIEFEFRANVTSLCLLLIAGIFAGGSMIVPGISGSFVLVLLGQYRVVIKAIKEFDLLLLGVIAIGTGVGIWGFAKLIDLFFKKFPKQTFYFILGLVVASLYPIFPGLPQGSLEVMLALVLAAAGAAVALVLGER